MTDGIIDLGEEEMRRFEGSWADNPALDKMREFIVSYARSKGGLTLAYWELNAGHYFGKPIMRRSSRIAEELHRWVIARWPWSANARGLIVESAPNYSAFSVKLEQAHERLQELEPSWLV